MSVIWKCPTSYRPNNPNTNANNSTKIRPAVVGTRIAKLYIFCSTCFIPIEIESNVGRRGGGMPTEEE